MQEPENRNETVLARMLSQDHYSQWLGLEILAHGDGYCKLSFVVRKEMLNGFGTIHGGVLFAAADSAFAFACNSEGVLTVALDAAINFIKPAQEGAILVVEGKKTHRGNKIGFYDVVTTDAQGNIVSTFKGTAYITGKSI